MAFGSTVRSRSDRSVCRTGALVVMVTDSETLPVSRCASTRTVAPSVRSTCGCSKCLESRRRDAESIMTGLHIRKCVGAVRAGNSFLDSSAIDIGEFDLCARNHRLGRIGDQADKSSSDSLSFSDQESSQKQREDAGHTSTSFHPPRGELEEPIYPEQAAL